MKKQNWSIYITAFLVSFAVIGLETVVNRLFGVRFWYHFAFMIISIALFGIGLGSLLLFAFNKLLKNIPDLTLAVIIGGLGLIMTWTLLAVNALPLEIDQLGTSAFQTKSFINYFLTLSIPFVIAGFVFSYLFTNYRKDINTVYFFDLAGGGLGALFSLVIFPHHGPFVTTFVFSILMLLLPAVILFKRIKWFSLITSAALIVVAFLWLYPQVKNVELTVSNAKRNIYSHAKKPVYSDWDNFGYTAVFKKSENSVDMVSTANFSTYANLFDTSTPEKFKAFRNHPDFPRFSQAFAIKRNPEDVAIVGVGAGKDVLICLLNGSKNVYGVEFNPTMYQVNHVFSNFTGGIINRKNVHIKMAEGRFFLKSSPRQYDVILFDNAIALAAAQSGAFTLAEGYLYTVEAMMDYVSKLKPNGLLYLSNPQPDADRFVTVCREAFKRLGRADEFKDSIWVGIDQNPLYRRAQVMLKNGKYTQAECQALANYLAAAGYKSLYMPYQNLGTYHEKLVRTSNIEKEYLSSRDELRPSSDDWPFFTQRVKNDKFSIAQNKKSLSYYWSSPFLILQSMIKYVLILAACFLIVPLIIFNIHGFKELDNKLGSIIYFAALGLGFMFIEIVLMQKYQLILGHPIYAFAVVLSTLMISSGIGSFLCERFKNPYTAIHWGMAGIIATTFISWLFIHFLGHAIIVWPFVARVIIIALLTSISGIFMGFMMPSGIRAISASENAVPWLWSINAVFSTIAGFVSVYISILHGFTAVLLIGLGVYILGWAAFSFRLHPRSKG